MKTKILLTFIFIYFLQLSAFAAPSHKDKLYFNLGFALSELQHYYNIGDNAEVYRKYIQDINKKIQNKKLNKKIRYMLKYPVSKKPDYYDAINQFSYDIAFIVHDDYRMIYFWGQCVGRLRVAMQLRYNPERFKNLLYTFEIFLRVNDKKMLKKFNQLVYELYSSKDKKKVNSSLKGIINYYSLENSQIKDAKRI